MTEKKETPGFFMSVKEVVTKIQSDVTLGIDLTRLRNKASGIKRSMEELYVELGRDVYKAISKKTDIGKASDKYVKKIKELETQTKAIEKQIADLEKKASPKPKLEPRGEKKTADAPAKTEEKKKQDG